MTTATAIAGAPAARSREAVIAGVIGNALEWYDFAVYGYFVSTISELFFPSSDPLASTLATYAVFGVGFVMRPVGSILFGTYGDRHGRRKALSAVTFLMAISTLAIGLLPTYDQAGLLAPILLVVARLIQGLSAGGEWGGSTAYIVEYAPEGRRGFIGSWQQFSVGGGFLLGSLSGTVLSFALSPEALTSWGWRVPFLLGIVVGGLGPICAGAKPTRPNIPRLRSTTRSPSRRSPKRSANIRARRSSRSASPYTTPSPFTSRSSI
jgi:MHS family proline/betaine transporter-like MFS transporter